MNYKLQLTVSEVDGNSEDGWSPMFESTILFEVEDNIQANQAMLKIVKAFQEENPGRLLKFEALLSDGPGNPVGIFSDE